VAPDGKQLATRGHTSPLEDYMTQDYLAIGSAVLLVASSIVSYFFGRRGAFEAGFNAGWKTCEKEAIKVILGAKEEL
jgi:hypothetical protein